MLIDVAILSPISALLGALIGGGASVAAAVYTQRSQNRLQRVAVEVAKRETIYGDFVTSASNLVLNAYTHDDINFGGEQQRVIGLNNRMRLFAPPDVLEGAEEVLKSIVEITLEPERRTPPSRAGSSHKEPRSRSACGVQHNLQEGSRRRRAYD